MSDEFDYTAFLRGKSVLKPKWIINIARGIPPNRVETEWPAPGEKLPPPWQDEWTALKHVRSSPTLAVGRSMWGDGHGTIDPRKLWACDDFQRLLGKEVREVLQKWARANNVTLPDVPSRSRSVTRIAPRPDPDDAAADAEPISSQQPPSMDAETAPDVDKDELRQWFETYLAHHAHDPKHPRESDIERAARDYFSPRKIRYLRPQLRSAPKPEGWNKWGRPPSN
jgi:hypothetical protein